VGYVNLASRSGMVNGYGNGLFGPDDSVTYGQAITILLRELGYTAADIGYYWPQDYLAFAASLDWDAGDSLDADSALNRGGAAILLLDFMRTENKGGQTLYSVTEQNAILLDNDVVSDEGYEDSALFYIPASGSSNVGGGNSVAGSSGNTGSGSGGGSLVYYRQYTALDDSLVGYSGDIIVDEDGFVVAFTPGDSIYTVETGAVLERSGGSNRITLLLDGEVEEYNCLSSLGTINAGSYGYLLFNENDYLIAVSTLNQAVEITLSQADDYDIGNHTETIYQDEGGDWYVEDWEDVEDYLAEDARLMLCLDEDGDIVAVWITNTDAFED
jgi:hypothetical protein